MTIKTSILALCLIASSLIAAPVNTTLFGNLAIKGYDAVAYFTQGKAVEGKKQYQTKWNDANWRFSSKENLRLFKQSPDAYAPQYGGYCAWAMADARKANIDPNSWKIVNQKLYLNYSPKIQKRWETDIPEFIRKADAVWATLFAEDNSSSKKK